VRLFQSPTGFVPKARPIRVPGDISSAAFFLVAAALVGGDRVVLEEVSINPTRAGILDLLETMGVSVQLTNRTVISGNEPVADLHVGGAPMKLKAVQIGGELVPRLIDELPVISVLAAAAHGETKIKDAAELRVKESDRIASTERLLKAVGADVLSTEDGLRIKGPTEFKAFHFDAGEDHRLAMAASIAALAADGPCEIAGAQSAAVSYPEFYDHLSLLTGT
jgi:3-phosphoshikimate 1-carboxyvinyltransferase